MSKLQLTHGMKAIIGYVSDKNPDEITYEDYRELCDKLSTNEPMINSSKENKKFREINVGIK